jgi:geranylgeranyl pyrophosphate synthase
MVRDAIFSTAEEFAMGCAATPEQQELLATAFRGRRDQIREERREPDDLDSIRLPLLVYAAVCGEEGPARSLAVAIAALWVGIDLLDDAMDGDLPAAWDRFHPTQATLAAATLISAVAPLALSSVDASPGTVIALHQILARGGLAMSAGQQRDVMLTRSATPTLDVVEAAIVGKTGDGMAMMTTLAARLAGATSAAIEAYAEMGRALGVAIQLHSDCYDIFAARESKDLIHGTRTMPIVWQLQRLRGAEREQFLTLLNRAETDHAARDSVREQLVEAGAIRGCAVAIDLYCLRAQQALARAHPLDPAGDALRRRIDETILLESEQS